MESVLKLVQIGFYITGSVIAVLTFIKAKNGLLNSVNTEYQKRIIDRLATLSEELYSEFDPASDNYWAKQNFIEDAITRFHEKIKDYKHEIITQKEMPPGIPEPENIDHLSGYLDKLKSDPFIPKEIRDSIVSNLEVRVETMQSAYLQVMQDYKKDLQEGKRWDTLDTNYLWIHNRINARMYENGVGISQIQQNVHEVRLAIQSHLEKFDPLKK
jgi:hypothetical protein